MENQTLMKLVREIDCFVFNFDPYEYRNNGTPEESFNEILNDIELNNGSATLEWLQTVIDECAEGEHDEDIYKEAEILKDAIEKYLLLRILENGSLLATVYGE